MDQAFSGRRPPRRLQSPVTLRLMFLTLYLNIHISYRSQLPSYVLYFVLFYLKWSKDTFVGILTELK